MGLHQVDWDQARWDEAYWQVTLVLQLGFLLRLLKFLWDCRGSDLRPSRWLHGLRTTKFQVHSQRKFHAESTAEGIPPNPQIPPGLVPANGDPNGRSLGFGSVFKGGWC